MQSNQSTNDSRTRSSTSQLVQRLRLAFGERQTRSLTWRVAQLDGLCRMLQVCEQEMIDSLREDLRKPRLEALAAEVAFTVSEALYARKHVGRWMEPATLSAPLLNQPGRCAIVPDPLGVVLIIGPWNYPAGLTLTPLVGALAAGNCAVVKPSEMAPATSAMLARRLPEFLDPACVAVVEGGVEETTELLAQRWDHIFFTGSTRVGRIVMAAAAKHLTPVTLELGGKSPCIVHRDANLAVAARRIAWGKWYNAGQTCVAPDYVLAHREIHDELLCALAGAVRELWGEHPRQSPDYGRLLNDRHYDRLVGLMASGRVVVGGETDRSDRYIAPTVLRDVSPDSAVMGEEIFGPILPVIEVDDVDDAIRFVNERPQPLALYLFCESHKIERRVIERTSAGGMSVNHVWMHLTVHDLPFGGVGDSGMGTYHGKASFDAFTHHKSVLFRSSKLDPRFLYPPYTALKEKLLRRFV